MIADMVGDGKLPLPSHASLPATRSSASRTRGKVILFLLALASALYYLGGTAQQLTNAAVGHHVYEPTVNPRFKQLFSESLAKCDAVDGAVGPPAHFHSRTKSERFDPKLANDLLIRNATLWTGEHGGKQVLHEHDVYLSRGLIQWLRPTGSNKATNAGAKQIDAAGRWLTPGLIDMHVHLSVGAMPALKGQDDVNSIGKNTNAYLRSVDGMNQHDVSFHKSIAGGITSGLVLPGSANSIGGQAFPIKYRPVSSHIPSDRLIEPPTSLASLGQGQGHHTEPELTTGMHRNDSSSSWRYIKMACGENARRVYKMTRFDEAWDFRRTFTSAKLLKTQQDTFCASARHFASLHGVDAVPTSEADLTFPQDLELEALVDLLRGKVKLNTHCYTQIDFEAFVRHSNEFQFPIAAFHHAHEAYLVPDLLKQAYGNVTPAVAIFSTNANYKLEAYFGSPFAGTLLDQAGITPIYKSDHPVTDSRRILNQAAQAHHFGLPEHIAMRSVISAPAERLGLDHRLGYLRRGWDADLVLWNAHPLRMGATPAQVVIDGIPQLGQHPHTPSPSLLHANQTGDPQKAPSSANFTAEINSVQQSYDKIITFEKYAFPTAATGSKDRIRTCVVFTNVKQHFIRAEAGVSSTVFSGENGTVVVQDGKILCSGSADTCASASACSSGDSVVDLKGGTLLPGLTSYGSNLGLTDIVAESEASDGFAIDAASSGATTPRTTHDYLHDWSLPAAVDGLQFGGHDLLRARASGVLSAIVFPQSDTFFSGISVKFDTGAVTTLDPGAVQVSQVAVHVTLAHNAADGEAPSISEQLGLLRRIFTAATQQAGGTRDSDKDDIWAKVVSGKLPLVVTALKADHIASLLRLHDSFPAIRLVLSGATEVHLVVNELAKRKHVSVLLIPQTWPRTYDELRALDGPPLTKDTTLSVLVKAGVKVALKIEEGWMAANLLWDATRAALETNGVLDAHDIVHLISTGIDDVLGISNNHSSSDFVAFDGNPFEYGSKVVAIHTSHGVEFVQ